MSGSLVIKPLQAKLTRDTDNFSKMDPYCQVIIGGQTTKGKTCKSGGKNPHWDDSISVKKSSSDSVLHVEVKDKDTFTADEIIGVAQVDLTKLSGSSAQWYPLYYKQKTTGDILIEIIYSPDHSSQPSGYPQQGIPQQGFPQQGIPQQGFPQQGYPQQGFPQQGYPQQGFPQQGYPTGQPIQTFAPTQNVTNMPGHGYPQQVIAGGPGYGQPGYGGQPIVGGHGHSGHSGHKDKKHKDHKEKKDKKNKKEKKHKKSHSGSSSSSDSD